MERNLFCWVSIWIYQWRSYWYHQALKKIVFPLIGCHKLVLVFHSEQFLVVRSLSRSLTNTLFRSWYTLHLKHVWIEIQQKMWGCLVTKKVNLVGKSPCMSLRKITLEWEPMLYAPRWRDQYSTFKRRLIHIYGHGRGLVSPVIVRFGPLLCFC